MQNKQPGKWIIAVIMLAFVTTLLMWPAFRTAAQKKDKPATTQNKSNNTTGGKSVNHGSGSKNATVDQEDIQKAMEEVQKSMQEFQEKDWPKVQVEIENAMKEIDMEKIQHEIQAAMKEVDMAKIQSEIKAAMKEIDVEKINAEIAKAMKSVDMKALEKDLAKIKEINTGEISRQMAKVKEELARTRIDIKTQMAQAGEQIKKAKAQLQLMKDGLDELEKDSLKKKNEKINIEYKNGIMYLNGAAQSKEVSDKYKKYFGDGNFIMNEHEDNDNDKEESDKVK